MRKTILEQLTKVELDSGYEHSSLWIKEKRLPYSDEQIAELIQQMATEILKLRKKDRGKFLTRRAT